MTHYLDSLPNIPAAFFAIAEREPEREVYHQSVASLSDAADEPRVWKSKTYSEVSARIQKIAQYLLTIGVGKGTKVAILSQSRPEWMESDIAVLALGGISVSVYQTLPAEDVGYILFDSESEVVFAENQEQVDKLLELVGAPCEIPGHEEREAQSAQITIKHIITFEETNPHELVTPLSEILKASVTSGLDTYQKLTRDDLASFVYTSGTTGPPKGVVQTHGNHLSNCRQAWSARILEQDSRLMLFLPLAHSFAKLMGYLGFLSEPSICFAGVPDPKSSKLNPASVTKDIREAGSTVIPIVPRLLEKMQAGIVAKSKVGGLSAKILSATLWAARENYAAKQEERAPSILIQIVHGGTASIRAKLKQKLFGPNFRYSVSGGAKLNPDVSVFFDALGVEILEGYGLTETCVATNINRLGHKKIGSVGPVLDKDIELRLGDDGEIIFRGPNIAQGYYKREQATNDSWDAEGWFYTGDLGAIDDDGFLSIVGRKKEIIVTSYGKNIAPEDIEAQLKSTSYVSQAILVGDGKPFCAAILTLDLAALKGLLQRLGVSADSALHENSQIIAEVWKDVEKVNEELAHHESVKKIAIAPEDFTVDNGLLTPTFKVKRKLVVKKYAELIDGLYAG